MGIYIAITVPDKVPNSQVHSQAKLRPLIPEAHENQTFARNCCYLYPESKTSHSTWQVSHAQCQVVAEVKGNPDQDRPAAVICLLKNDFK